mgnify:CR=1 FL=1
MDFVLAVDDVTRTGGLRLSRRGERKFLSMEDEPVPPQASLRDLEAASRRYEEKDIDPSILRLLSPGSSLGGARPKANVRHPDGSLWMAKFPSRHDDVDTGAWEYAVNRLAALCGLDVPEAVSCRLSDGGATFMARRFDRTESGGRVHFASAMTMMGKHDNDPNGSYLDLADFIQKYSFSPRAELHQLWKRLVFNMLISNTDDHLRNHGFILADNHWRLSPLYDVNPIPYGNHLSLTVDGNNDMIDLSIALDTAPFYDLPRDDAEKYISWSASIITRNWKKIALHYGAPRKSIEYMKAAFLSAKEAM